MASITLDKISKRYGAVQIIDGLNLAVRDGEFLVLVGPSDCGKSTALRMIAGLEEISGGIVSIDERVVNTVDPKDRDIAMVFQSPTRSIRT
jgi:multiple sugar transport system ATP-binding protein